jgi:Cd2+/Zn2+-exporting ATPase
VQGTLSAPPVSTAPPATSGEDSRLPEYLLAGSAILAWLALGVAFLLQVTTETTAPVLIAIYVVSCLAGGTLAAKTAIADLFHGQINIDLLMVMAAIGAAILGAWAEGAMLLALFSTSNALEHFALDRTRSAVRKLMDLTPPTARLLSGGSEREVPVSKLQLDDLVVVRPGEKIPVDGTVTSGATDVNQAAITGESMPVRKEPGDEVFAGTINGSGSINIQVTRLSTESTLARIARMVAAAQEEKGEAERFTDKFEGPYAIGVIVVSALIGIVSMLLGADVDDAFYRAITLLVVASPCALVISTPAATLSAISSAARGGVLVKGGSHLDSVGVIDTIAFDKTGTLTLGKPALTDLEVFGDYSREESLQRIAAAERLSEHPIARAIVRGAEAEGIEIATPSAFDSDPGRGVVATVGDRQIIVGNETIFAANGILLPPEVVATANRIRGEGRTAVIAADREGFVAVAGVADQIRPGVPEAIGHLRDLGIKRVVMLTGDNELVGHAIGRQLGIDEVYTDLQPAEKLAKIRELEQQGTVAMVGDGVNDAPALAIATLGIAMGAGGTDVALETADMVLITGDLRQLPFAISLARRMRLIIRLSIAFALLVIATLAVSTLFVGIPLPLGVVGHEGSTVIVVLAGLSLLAYRPGHRRPQAEAGLAT